MRPAAVKLRNRPSADVGCGSGECVLLDGITLPHGPIPAVLEAIEAAPDLPSSRMAPMLRTRLGELYRVPAESILFVNDVDMSLAAMAGRHSGPIVAFPPSASASLVQSSTPSPRQIFVGRGTGTDAAVTVDCAVDIPVMSVAMVDSPTDPLGSILAATDAIRLARACRAVVVDERFADFTGMSLLSVAGEFENIVILRSFAFLSGIADLPCAWAIASPRTAAAIGLEETLPSPTAISASIATLDNLSSIIPTLNMVRDERSRLFRLLRKLSFLEPIPSRGPFLSGRVDLVSRDAVVSALVQRGVRVHAPYQPGLERIIRFGIGSRSAMERLRWALLDLASEIFSQPLALPSAQTEWHRAGR